MLSSELLTYKSKVVSDDSTNGGRMSSTLVTSGVVQNVWSHVPKALRSAGNENATRTLAGQDRKLFDKAANDDDESLLNPGYYIEDTLGEDWCIFAPVGQRHTQSDWRGGSAPSRWYGTGVTTGAITGGVTTTITVDMKDTTITDTIGVANDLIRISDKSDPDSGTGNEDFMTVNGSAPSINGTEVTFTFTAAVPNSYASGVKVSAVYEPGSDVECVVGTVTDANNLLDDSLVTLDNIGTVEQTITITFSDSSNFTVASDDGDITLAAGDTGTEYAPSNPDFTKPYLTIPIAAWTGSPAGGNTVVIPTSPAATPLVQKRVIPANCASLANNRIRKVTLGESPT